MFTHIVRVACRYISGTTDCPWPSSSRHWLSVCWSASAAARPVWRLEMHPRPYHRTFSRTKRNEKSASKTIDKETADCDSRNNNVDDIWNWSEWTGLGYFILLMEINNYFSLHFVYGTWINLIWVSAVSGDYLRRVGRRKYKFIALSIIFCHDQI